jgi:hypothetical protein
MDVRQTATHLGWPEHRVQAAFEYAAAFPEEIAAALEKQDAQTFETLSHVLPQAELFAAGEGAGPSDGIR